MEGTRSHIETTETTSLHVKGFELLEGGEGAEVDGEAILVVSCLLQCQALRWGGEDVRNKAKQ